MAKHKMVVRILPDGGTVALVGRECWCLNQLLDAGARGCTPIERPAPRWSHYVWRLRKFGILVETVHEPHDGPYAGTHARYVLHSDIAIVEEIGATP